MHIRITNPFLGGLVLMMIAATVIIFHPRRSAPVSIGFGCLMGFFGLVYWLIGIWNWWQRRK